MGHDAASRITGIADALAAARSQTLGYHALDRLTSATVGYGSPTYGWDVGGNRTSRAWSQGGTTTTDSATFAAASTRLLSVSRGGRGRTLGHDTAGNVTGATRFDGTASLGVGDRDALHARSLWRISSHSTGRPAGCFALHQPAWVKGLPAGQSHELAQAVRRKRASR